MKLLLFAFLSVFTTQCSRISQELLILANEVPRVPIDMDAPSLTNEEVIAGLKEALQLGIKKGQVTLEIQNWRSGYFVAYCC